MASAIHDHEEHPQPDPRAERLRSEIKMLLKGALSHRSKDRKWMMENYPELCPAEWWRDV